MRLFEKTPEAMTGSRIAAVDYAKTLAIVCVVMIHVSSEVLLGRQIGSAAWLEGLFWSSLARGAVPLFLMCSGVLFLDRSGGLSPYSCPEGVRNWFYPRNSRWRFRKTVESREFPFRKLRWRAIAMAENGRYNTNRQFPI